MEGNTKSFTCALEANAKQQQKLKQMICLTKGFFINKKYGVNNYSFSSVDFSSSFRILATSSSVLESLALQIFIRMAARFTFSESSSTEISPCSISETISCNSSNASV